jgi:hypothetical protein
MSQTLAELVQVAVEGRYKLSLWGVAPLPRRIRRMPPGIDPDRVHSINYEHLVRCLDRDKPVGRPCQSHSLKEIESHLRLIAKKEQSETAFGLELIARQADVYITAFRHNHRNASPLAVAGNCAFKDLWDIVVGRMDGICPKCTVIVKKRLALNGFVT